MQLQTLVVVLAAPWAGVLPAVLGLLARVPGRARGQVRTGCGPKVHPIPHHWARFEGLVQPQVLGLGLGLA